ncbi:TPA: hypothetical protein HA265_06970 [Candidatus Woesearchaeota archaeon]|nr:hypothetical protein [Candidatus Woesearchaeota archaeon]
MITIKTEDLRVKSLSSLKSRLTKISRSPVPDFAVHKEELSKLDSILKKYSKFKNLIIIANGGSQSTFRAFHHALVPMGNERKVFFLTSMEPDLIDMVKVRFAPKKTLVMPISKSGDTVGVLESLFAFSEYTVLPVTSPNKGALFELAQKMGWDIIPHPEIGGRFSGITASAYAPALFCGINVEEIDKGTSEIYKQCHPSVPVDKNPALDLACRLFMLEKKGYSEIFCPVYSCRLFGFALFIMQIIHETVGKQGKGQTIYTADAPESQHHTNQRFFGGHKNVIGLFVNLEHQDDEVMKVHVPEELHHIRLRDGTLSDIDKVAYAKAFSFEYQGTYKDAVNSRIPVATVTLDKISPFSIGEFLGFWHYVAVYSAMLRQVDPFDQPQVENSKKISFELRRRLSKE